MEKKTVLVFDARQRSSLAATRALGKREDIVVYTTDCTNSSLAGASKYSQAYFQSPDPIKSTERFITWLIELIAAKKIDFLLPVTEVSSRTLIENKHKLPDIKLPFSDLDTVLLLSDKNKLVQLAEKLGIPVPTSTMFESALDVDQTKISLPCVLKPSLSKVNIDGAWMSTQVHIVHTKTELKAALENAYFKFPFMIQQYVEGQGAGIFCYYQNSQAKAFFAHRRIREKPPSGGVSVLSESVAVDATMQRYATLLLDHVSWHGVAMVEFKVGADGVPYLMEINTRLWGSLQLAIDAGVNFPGLLFDGEFVDLPQQSTFSTGVQLRWLLGDVDNLYLNLKDKKQPFKSKLMHVARFLTPKWTNRKHEVNRIGDLGPFQYELKQYFSGK
ncbi:carboxylate--amine ligase [Alteromonas sp. ASW11-130]|uniref:carboxylate--amine ligase n=1 Tax=Alteromonas sp. ASW11-130 TaxID=3015775 RepID=UPI002242A874|nr:ATP-grasp domain-containing protein [Alteromonas sp. ASW11-130]MCW8091294.1 ATP-grasp domain-containing protein [Alteromonas sp. ASW11-130]